MNKLTIFLLSVVAFICLSFFAFKDMQTEIDLIGMFLTCLFTFSFIIALLSFKFGSFKK